VWQSNYINSEGAQNLLILCLNAQEILSGKCLLKRPAERHRYRQKNNMKMDLLKYQAVDEASHSVKVSYFFYIVVLLR
jgi:hypothetical protein